MKIETVVRTAAQEHDKGATPVYNILKMNQMILLHELNKDDFDWRLQFCEDLINRIDNDI